MDTYGILESALRKTLGYPDDRKITDGDWDRIDSFSILPDKRIGLNDFIFHNAPIQWDLHYVFRFRRLKRLSISTLNDAAIIEAAGLEGFHYDFWFKRFPLLVTLRMNTGSYETGRRIDCRKVNLTTSVAYIIYYHNQDGCGIEIRDGGGRVLRDLFFKNRQKVSRDWYAEILNYVMHERSLPDDDWFRELRERNISRNAAEYVEILEAFDSLVGDP